MPNKAPDSEGLISGVVADAINAIKNSINPDSPMLDRIKFAENYVGKFGFNISPMQDPVEIRKFMEYLGGKKLDRIAEVGTGTGGLLFLLAGVVAPGGIVASVDLPQKLNGGPDWKDEVYREYPTRGKRIALVRGDSGSPTTVSAVSEIIGGRADLLFIDADHSYESVERDYMVWSGIVAKGGIVAFHDIKLRDVGRLWWQIKSKYGSRCREIVASPDDGMPGYGIGILEPHGDN